MIRTGRRSPVFYIGFLLALIVPHGLFAQDYTLEATVSENKIFIGEQFNLNIEVTGSSMRDVSLPVLPQLNGVRALSSTPSRSTSISIINGRTTTSTSYSFSLVARDAGKYTIPPVTIEIDGETRSTNPIQIEVLEKENLAPDGSKQLPDIFLEVELDDTNPVAGQQIVASIVLYFKQGIEITSFQPTAGWRTDGFWKEELQNIRQPQAESIILDGVRYRTATLLRYALFPSRSGTMTLSEYPLSVGIRTRPARNDPFGSFFGGGTNQRRVSVESDPIELDVRPLPQTTDGTVSINAVGNLSVNRSINRDQVVTGETVELITTVTGTGNIPLVRRPEYNLPEGIDLYTPQENSNVERSGLNIRGEKTYTELLVPRAPGKYTVPEQRVAVFNPQQNRYRTTTLPALSFEATPGPAAEIAASGGSISGVPKPITGLAVWKSHNDRPIQQTTLFWILFILPILALFVSYWKRSQLERLQSDKTFARRHHATEQANERLKLAKKSHESHNPKELYNFLHKALSGYISDKLGLPEAGSSDAELVGRVKDEGVGPGTVKSLKILLDRCATISYAPTGSMDDQLADIKEAEQIIKKLEKQL